MRELLAVTTALLVLLGEQVPRLRAARTALLATGDEFVCLPHGGLGLAGGTRSRTTRSLCGAENPRQAASTARLATRQGPWREGPCGTRNADLPPIGLATEGQGLEGPSNGV